MNFFVACLLLLATFLVAVHADAESAAEVNQVIECGDVIKAVKALTSEACKASSCDECMDAEPKKNTNDNSTVPEFNHCGWCEKPYIDYELIGIKASCDMNGGLCFNSNFFEWGEEISYNGMKVAIRCHDMFPQYEQCNVPGWLAVLGTGAAALCCCCCCCIVTACICKRRRRRHNYQTV